jgi:hypothetical protein
MLAEALHLALSLPGIPPRHWSHASDAIGLWARGRRQQKAWAPHLAATKAAILGAMPEGRGRVVVLGSGPLFDVPLRALSEAFAEVVLVDRIHLWSARRQRRPNVVFLSRDLADGLAHVPPADWTISLNLLSQLARGAADGDERRVIGLHLRDLAARAGKATLITDTSFRASDGAGGLIEFFELLYGIDLPPPASRWEWEVAPFGEEGRDRRRIHQVAAWPDWTAASLRAP